MAEELMAEESLYEKASPAPIIYKFKTSRTETP